MNGKSPVMHELQWLLWGLDWCNRIEHKKGCRNCWYPKKKQPDMDPESKCSEFFSLRAANIIEVEAFTGTVLETVERWYRRAIVAENEYKILERTSEQERMANKTIIGQLRKRHNDICNYTRYLEECRSDLEKKVRVLENEVQAVQDQVEVALAVNQRSTRSRQRANSI
jgi:hypothetical protein